MVWGLIVLMALLDGVEGFYSHLTSRLVSFESMKRRLRESEDDFDSAFNKGVTPQEQRKLEARFGSQRKNDKNGMNIYAEDDDEEEKQRWGLPQVADRWEVLNRALIAGVFVAGIGAGVTIDSAINTNPRDLASRDAIDRSAPNPKLCAAFGSSAMVMDQRIFVTFNPFNVYVAQADTKPGCVLRPSNVVSQLRNERQLITDDEVEGCKNGFNTWAFVGDIDDKPQLSCVFKSDDAQNEFLSYPKVGLGQDVYQDNNAAVAGAEAAAKVAAKAAVDNTPVLSDRIMSTPGPSDRNATP
jgi:hypothetical protein